MLHTLSNTFLFPPAQLLLPLTEDKAGKVLDQDATLFNWAQLKLARAGCSTNSGNFSRNGRWAPGLSWQELLTHWGSGGPTCL